MLCLTARQLYIHLPCDLSTVTYLGRACIFQEFQKSSLKTLHIEKLKDFAFSSSKFYNSPYI